MRIIAGRWRGRRLTPLRGEATRPTSDRVREAWMSAMGGTFHGLRVVDLFAGSGALGLECLSRGAERCTFVENAGAALRTLEENVALLGAGSGVRVVRADVSKWLDRAEGTAFDLALADPPYGRGLAADLVARFVERPFARELWVEHRSDDRMPPVAGLRQRRYGDTVLSSLSAAE